MSFVYLIRHGQAGTRHHYDTLSPLGREQSRLLGEYLLSQGLRFETALSGGLCRQQETAHEVMGTYSRAGAPFPELVIDDGWREFDLDQVYRGIAPQLCAADVEFEREYDALLDQLRASREEAEAAVHRRWSPCDVKVVEAWIRERFQYDGESWAAFRLRVCRAPLGDGNVIVFTSATPAAVWAGIGLEIADERVLRIAGVLYNTSITVLRLKAGAQVRLFSFNGVPHLTRAEMRTHR